MIEKTKGKPAKKYSCGESWVLITSVMLASAVITYVILRRPSTPELLVIILSLAAIGALLRVVAHLGAPADWASALDLEGKILAFIAAALALVASLTSLWFPIVA